MRNDRLDAYLARLGLAAPVSRDCAGLEAVLRAHRCSIGFENFDVMLGRGISVDPDAVFGKLVTRGRGGYCFEHNGLFGEMLEALGFANRAVMGRVWLGVAEGVMPPRAHMLRLVDLLGEPWIADAGFGGAFAPAMPLRDGALAQTPDGARHRLRLVGEIGDLRGQWLLERLGPLAATDGRAQGEGLWLPQYSFDLGEVAFADIEMANHWVCTRPDTRFTTLHIASLVLPDGFVALTGRRLRVFSGGRLVERELAEPREWREAVAEALRLPLSEEEVADLRLF